MKDCLVCGTTAPDDAHVCASCGSADWSPVKKAPTASAPAPASSTPSRDKRPNR